MDHMTNAMSWIDFDRIENNPYRDLERNPLAEEHIESLQRSVEQTGFWNSCIVRPHPTKPNHFQLMFGHARLTAAKRAGLTGAFFTIRDASDEEAIILMNNENATQKRDQYFAIAEAVRAAMGYIMLKLLHSDTADNFIGGDDPNRNGQLLADVKAGGNVGKETIFKFFNGTLNINNIQLAIETMKDSGEIAAWHKTNNPFMKEDKTPIKPLVSEEAISKFEKPDHVRTFTKAVKDYSISVEHQLKLYETIKNKLAPPPKKSPSGRETFQAGIPSDKRFNSTNIRKIIVEEGLNLTRSKKEKERLARQHGLTTLERNLTDIESGLTRAVSGYIQMKTTIRVMNGLNEEDYTSIVEIKLRNIADKLRELKGLLEVKDTRALVEVSNNYTE